MSNTDTLLVSINDASRILGVSRSTIYRLLKDQTITARKVRSRNLIEVKSIRTLGGEA